MELIDALRTTGAVRQYTSVEVADETVYRLLDTARFAPNGGNRQAWRVVVVKDPEARRVLRDLYLPGWYQYLANRLRVSPRGRRSPTANSSVGRWPTLPPSPRPRRRDRVDLPSTSTEFR